MNVLDIRSWSFFSVYVYVSGSGSGRESACDSYSRDALTVVNVISDSKGKLDSGAKSAGFT